MVDRAKILEAVNTAIEKAPERKFSESIDITINLKNIDMAQPKNRIDETILLPHGIGEKIGICVIGKGDIVTQAKDAKVDLIIGPEEVERLGGAPREARRVASKYRYFLAEMAVMPQVGRFLGPRLGPRGRMPMPITGRHGYPPDSRASAQLGEDQDKRQDRLFNKSRNNGYEA